MLNSYGKCSLCRYWLGFRSIAADIVNRDGDNLLAVKGNQERLHNMFLNDFSFAQLTHLDGDKFETEEVGKRGRKMVRSYYVVPFTEVFGDFFVDWEGLEN